MRLVKKRGVGGRKAIGEEGLANGRDIGGLVGERGKLVWNL